MKMKIRLAVGAVLMVLVAAAAWWWCSQPTFPQFGPATAEPQVAVQSERDYGHRTGDLITVDVFVLLSEGQQLDNKAVTVDGDFELASAPEIIEKEVKNGAQVAHEYRVRLAVQSFRIKPKVELKTVISYVSGETRKNIEVPVQTFYTSNTWDGRERLEEGADPRVTVWQYAPRFVVSLALSVVLFAVMLVMAIRHSLRSRPVPQVDQAKIRFGELLSYVAAGTAGREHYLELDGLVRANFEIGPIPAGQLEGKGLPATAVEFLRISEVAIYGDQELADEPKQRLQQLGTSITLQWVAPAPPVVTD